MSWIRERGNHWVLICNSGEAQYVHAQREGAVVHLQFADEAVAHEVAVTLQAGIDLGLAVVLPPLRASAQPKLVRAQGA